jgi:hypothetical protein
VSRAVNWDRSRRQQTQGRSYERSRSFRPPKTWRASGSDEGSCARCPHGIVEGQRVLLWKAEPRTLVHETCAQRLA